MRTQWIHLAAVALASALVIAFATTAAPALPAPGQQVQAIDPNGEPKGFKEGDTKRIALWHGKKGWHLRTTTAKVMHHFTGKIVVEGGTIEFVEPFRLEDKGKFADWWKIGEKDREMVINFKTDHGLDGINFRVSKEAKLIRFNLHIDGEHHKHLILIGKEGAHPDRDPFVLVAHPGLK